MLNGYRKMLIEKFWRLAESRNPPVGILYNIVSEIVRLTELSDEDKQMYESKLEQLSNFEVDGIKMSIDGLDLMYSRNIDKKLDTRIEYDRQWVTMAKLCMTVKSLTRKLTSLMSDMAVKYFFEVQYQKPQKKRDNEGFEL